MKQKNDTTCSPSITDHPYNGSHNTPIHFTTPGHNRPSNREKTIKKKSF
ncbi:hypothetical protein OAT16_06380 [Prolixibacteraceae bacterium]|nr:hypothetical protein [Prolixibacteraceae bacterium]